MSHNKTLLDGSYLMVSVSKFGIDTTEILGIVSIRKSWYRPSLYCGSTDDQDEMTAIYSHP